jgi:hypothetical protein
MCGTGYLIPLDKPAPAATSYELARPLTVDASGGTPAPTPASHLALSPLPAVGVPLASPTPRFGADVRIHFSPRSQQPMAAVPESELEVESGRALRSPRPPSDESDSAIEMQSVVLGGAVTRPALSSLNVDEQSTLVMLPALSAPTPSAAASAPAAAAAAAAPDSELDVTSPTHLALHSMQSPSSGAVLSPRPAALSPLPSSAPLHPGSGSAFVFPDPLPRAT